MVAMEASTPSDKIPMMAILFCLVICTFFSIRNGNSAVVTSVIRLNPEMMNVMLTVIVLDAHSPLTSPQVAAMGLHCRRT